MESAIYIVATPIGNLADITIRGLDVLKGVDIVAAEDTRHSRKLLEHYDIDARMVSLHDHNEKEKSDWIISQVEDGGAVALISDAGTPLISDPGYTLVSKAKARGVKVVPIPGPSALITALSASGLASDRFSFEGFLPVKNKAKREKLESIKDDSRTLIMYESPKRVLDTLQNVREIMGDRQICVARELTKRYETIKTGFVSELELFLSSSVEQQKGEFVLILSGCSREPMPEDEILKRRLLSLLLKELPPKKASAVVAEFYGGTKRELYEMALSMKS